MLKIKPASLASIAAFSQFVATEYGSDAAALAAFDRAASEAARAGDVAGVVVASALGVAIEEGSEAYLRIAAARLA